MKVRPSDPLNFLRFKFFFLKKYLMKLEVTEKLPEG